MSTEILMPALSPTMTEGNLSKWLIKKGDTVKAGDLIAEIETDKATMEVEAVDEGVVLDLLFKEGEANIPVNKAIAIIGDPNEKVEIKKETPIEKVIEEKKIEKNIETKTENKKADIIDTPSPKIEEDTNLSSEEINQIRFIKPSLFERFYIAISNPVFTYLFFALGFALIGLELFAIGPGLMAFNGALLIAFSSMTFHEYNLNYIGLLIFLVSFLMFIKVLSRGFFGPLGVAALIVMHGSSLIMFSDYLLRINHFLLFGSSSIIAFFYFVAIPTVIRSRLTTDTSAMSSLVNSQVTLLE
mgnify:CR=1 FL=1